MLTHNDGVEMLPIGAVFAFRQQAGGVATGATAVRLLKSDPMRVGVMLSNSGGFAVSVGLDKSVSPTNGITLNTSITKFDINDHMAPGLASNEIWVVSPGGASSVGYIATYKVPDV